MRLTINAELTDIRRITRAKGDSLYRVVTMPFTAALGSAEIADLAQFLDQRFTLTVGDLAVQAELRDCRIKKPKAGEGSCVVFPVKASMTPEEIGQAAVFIGQSCQVRLKSAQGSFDELVGAEAAAS